MEHHPKQVFQYSESFVFLNDTSTRRATQQGVKYPMSFSHALGTILDAGTEQASGIGVAQDLVLMNTEELLMHMTANSSLGCSNCEMVVQELQEGKERKKQTKTLDSQQ